MDKNELAEVERLIQRINRIIQVCRIITYE